MMNVTVHLTGDKSNPSPTPCVTSGFFKIHLLWISTLIFEGLFTPNILDLWSSFWVCVWHTVGTYWELVGWISVLLIEANHLGDLKRQTHKANGLIMVPAFSVGLTSDGCLHVWSQQPQNSPYQNKPDTGQCGYLQTWAEFTFDSLN